MQNEITIVVPVYNVEDYLEHCLDSIIKQSLGNIEIMLIDDGSTDSSGLICDKYAQKDSRIKVYHKINEGLSATRNYGIERCNTKYITFLDSDDYLSYDFLENAYNLISANKCDIAIMKQCYVKQESYEQYKSVSQGFVKVMNSEEAIEQSLYQKEFDCNIGSKLYKTELFKEIRFPVGKIHEDLAVFHRILDCACSIVYSNKIGHYYRQRSGSIMHSFNENRMFALELTDEIYEFCNEKYPNIVDAAVCRMSNMAIHLLLDLPDHGDIHDRCFPILMCYIKRSRVKTIMNAKARVRDRLAALLTYLGEFALKKVYRSKFALKKRGI